MLKILTEVAARRIKLNDDNFNIQLSSVLMDKVIDNIADFSDSIVVFGG